MPNQRWLRIIPVALIMYTIAFIDRTNISLALPSMSRELHIDPAQAGSVAGIFFWGYLVLQIPGGHLAHRWSPKGLISILLVAWGICAVGCGLVRTWHELWVMRLLLGVSEGGVYPATLILLANWFPRAERARANAFWMVCLPLAVVVSSPLSGWILDRWNWRVMLIAEGALPFLWLSVWMAFIDDHPHQAGWISAEERDYLESTLHGEKAELEPADRLPYLGALLRPQVFELMSIYFLFISAQLGYLFWLPSALQSAKKFSNLVVGILFTLPFIVGAISMVVNSQHSDKSRERCGHVATALGLGGLFLLAGVLTSNYWPLLAFVFLCLAAIGAYAPLGPFWAIPTETLPRHVVGSVMGLVNAIGNLGGYFGPLLVGYLDKRTGNFYYGFALLGVGQLIGSALPFLLKPTLLPLIVETTAQPDLGASCLRF